MSVESERHVSLEEFSKFEDRKRIQFINSLSGFKSCNLIGTSSKSNDLNVSVISSAFHLGASPALMGFIIRPDSVPRDTLINIRETGVCTLNHINSDIYEQAHQTSARYPKEISEFEACNLTPEYKNKFFAPFIKESKIKLSLELVREVPIIENGTHMLICKITNVYFPKDSLEDDGYINIERADSVCVSGLNSYHSTERLSYLAYAKPKS